MSLPTTYTPSALICVARPCAFVVGVTETVTVGPGTVAVSVVVTVGPGTVTVFVVVLPHPAPSATTATAAAARMALRMPGMVDPGEVWSLLAEGISLANLAGLHRMWPDTASTWGPFARKRCRVRNDCLLAR